MRGKIASAAAAVNPLSPAWVSANPGLTVTAVHRIEQAAAGCTVTLSVHYEGALAGIAVKLMGAITEKYVGWEAEGLKKASEGEDDVTER